MLSNRKYPQHISKSFTVNSHGRNSTLKKLGGVKPTSRFVTVCLVFSTIFLQMLPLLSASNAFASTTPASASSNVISPAKSDGVAQNPFGQSQTLFSSSASLATQQPVSSSFLAVSPSEASATSPSSYANSLYSPLLITNHRVDTLKAHQQWFYGQRAYPNNTTPPNAFANAAQQKTNVAAYNVATSGGHVGPNVVTNWLALGPAPTVPLNPTTSDASRPGPYGNVSGRVTSLAFDQVSNPNVLYAGGADGGLWKTTNGGTSWTPLTDNVSSVITSPLAVGAIALDPSNPQIIYIGTGEANYNFDGYYSSGLLKSSDGGSTWTQLGASVFSGQRINATTGIHI